MEVIAESEEELEDSGAGCEIVAKEESLEGEPFASDEFPVEDPYHQALQVLQFLALFM